jgi:hypothetical protein
MNVVRFRIAGAFFFGVVVLAEVMLELLLDLEGFDEVDADTESVAGLGDWGVGTVVWTGVVGSWGMGFAERGFA